MKSIYLLLAEGFEEIEALTPVDILRRAGLNVVMVSTTHKLEVTGAHQITVKADKYLEEIKSDDIDVLILPGGMPGTNNLNNNPEVKKLIKHHASQNKLTAAICAAPLILGEMGLLQGEKATCYPGYENRLTGAHLLPDQVVVSNHYLTGKGAGAAQEFALKLVELLISPAKAAELTEKMMIKNP